jgi:hypothetical protein
VYFLSMATVKSLLADPHVLAEAERALDTAEANTNSGTYWAATALWEDVDLGLMLAQMRPASSLAVVRIEWDLYSEQWGMQISPSSIVWHAKTKEPARLLGLHAWAVAARHHCTRTGLGLERQLDARIETCQGGNWSMHTHAKNDNCSVLKADLKPILTDWSSSLHANVSQAASSRVEEAARFWQAGLESLQTHAKLGR